MESVQKYMSYVTQAFACVTYTYHDVTCLQIWRGMYKIQTIKKALKKKSSGLSMLVHQDSNLDKQYQKLLCYHYTMDQTCWAFSQKRCKDMETILYLQIFKHFLSFYYDQIVVFLSALYQKVLIIE